MATAELTTFKAPVITFSEGRERLELISTDYSKLAITELTDKENNKKIHEAERHLVSLRVQVEEERVAMKAPALAYGRKVDEVASELKAILAPAEEHTKAMMKEIKAEEERLKAERAEAKRKLTQERLDALQAVNCSLPLTQVEAMDDETFQERLAEATEAKRIADEEAAKAEAERLRLKAEEEARVKAEQERLDAQKAEQEKIAAELKAKEEALAAKQREIEEANKAEAARLQKIADEQAAAAKKIEDEKLEQQRQLELEQAKKEAAEKAEADLKAKQAREAEEAKVKAEKAEAARKRKEARRPLKEKIQAFANLVSEIEVPSMGKDGEDAEAKLIQIMANVVQEITDVASEVDSE